MVAVIDGTQIWTREIGWVFAVGCLAPTKIVQTLDGECELLGFARVDENIVGHVGLLRLWIRRVGRSEFNTWMLLDLGAPVRGAHDLIEHRHGNKIVE